MCSQEKSAAAIFDVKIAAAFLFVVAEGKEKHEEKHL